MEQVCHTEEGVIGNSDAQFLRSGGVAYKNNEEEIAADIPVEIVKICWEAVEDLSYNRCCVLCEGVAGHYVEEGEVGCQASSALFYQLDH